MDETGASAQEDTFSQRMRKYYLGTLSQHDGEDDKAFQTRVRQEKFCNSKAARHFELDNFPITAVFFDAKGRLLAPLAEHCGMLISQNILVRIDRYLPHIQLHMSAKPMDDGATERVRNGDTVADARDSVRIYIDHNNYTSHRCGDFNTDVALSQEEQAYFSGLPHSVKQHISVLRATGDHPVALKLEFAAEPCVAIRVYQNTPFWAQSFTEQIKQGEVYAVMNGFASTKRRFDFIAEIFRYNKTFSPMDKFYTANGTSRRVDPDHMTHMPQELQGYKYHPRPIFFDLDEFTTMSGVHLLAAWNVACAECQEYCESPCRLHLLKIANADDRFYVGFIPIRDECRKRPSTGAPVTIEFIDEEDPLSALLDERWHGFITKDFISRGNQKLASMLVSRPRHNNGKSYSDHEVLTVKTKGFSYRELADIIERDPGNSCQITIEPEGKVFNCLLKAVNRLADTAEDPYTRWNETIKIALLGSRMDKLLPQNMFDGFGIEFADIVAMMSLNEAQKAAVEAMRYSPGRLHLIQGPPGTGKTEMARQILQPFLRSAESHQALFITSANSVVNSFAESLENILHSLSSQDLLPKSVYILRVHAESSEKSIRDVTTDASKEKLSVRLHRNLDSINWDELDECTRVLTRTYLDKTKSRVADPKYAAITDSRVKFPQLSVSEKMLEITGINQGSHTHPDEQRFLRFRGRYNAYCKGVIADKQEFEELIKDAQDYTIRNARILVTTTATGGLSHVLNVIKDSVELIIHDEAPRANETSLLPYFAERFTRKVGFVMLGDWLQLQPIVLNTPQDNLFAPQESLSFAYRCAENGLPVLELTEQHRMVPDLCNMANELTYNDKLTTHESALLENRPLAIDFQSFAENLTGSFTSKMLIDVKPCAANTTEVSYPAMSRFNHGLVITAINTVELLLKLKNGAKIGLITSYTAQNDCHYKAIQGMGRNKIDISKVTNITVDGAQGQEYDYVIYVALCGKSGLGFQADPRRNNVATTRARDGFILIADADTILSVDKNETTAIARTVKHLKTYTHVVNFNGRLPSCNHYRPQ